jgi:aryl-alcohol dehydrogenase-like predicted oxidoreductase
MVNRREFIGITLGTGVTLALTSDLLRALHQSGGKLIQRAIPSSGEMIPATGLSFSNHPGCADHAELTKILEAFYDAGGRVYDALHVNPANENFHITAATELGIQDKVFWSTRGNPANEAPAANLMRNEPIDFIGVDYDVSSRFVEDKVLPLAQQRKIGVMAFFPFNNASGLSCTGGTSLFTRVANKPVPEWAAEFDAATWSQFFLKYVISHPAITVARTGTTKVAHMIDNIGGGIGRLPNDDARKRMAAFIDALTPAPPPPGPAPLPPGIAVSAAILERYPATIRRYRSSPARRHASRIREGRSSSSSLTLRAT